MSPLAALAIIATSLGVIALLIVMAVRGHEPQHVRQRDLKAARQEAQALREALQQIEDQAVNNPDGFILNTDVLKITRSI